MSQRPIPSPTESNEEDPFFRISNPDTDTDPNDDSAPSREYPQNGHGSNHAFEAAQAAAAAAGHLNGGGGEEVITIGGGGVLVKAATREDAAQQLVRKYKHYTSLRDPKHVD